MTPRPLPVCPTQQQGETLPEYAARVLRQTLATGCTATLTDEQIALADHAACRALAGLPGCALDPADAAIARRLNETRHELAAALRRRATLDAQDRAAAQQAAQDAPPPTGGKNPGRPAPLQPPPPTRPPQGAYATVGDGINF